MNAAKKLHDDREGVYNLHDAEIYTGDKKGAGIEHHLKDQKKDTKENNIVTRPSSQTCANDKGPRGFARYRLRIEILG